MGDIQVECPVCGFIYFREEEADYIEGYGMCYHCFCEFDDEVAEDYWG